METTKKQKKRNGSATIKNILLLFTTLTCLFLSLEFVFRVFPKFSLFAYQAASNDRLIYELRPNYYISSHDAWISPQGLNDRVFTTDKPLGVYRIAIIGDSTSFGWKVGMANGFPKLLEKKLNAFGDKKYEVINFSVPGYNMAQELEVLKSKALQFHPDMVILVFCGNDTHICNYIKPKITLFNYLYNKSHFVHFIFYKLDQILTQSNDRNRYTWELFKKNTLGMFYYQQTIVPVPGLEETIYVAGNPPEEKNLVPRRYWRMLGIKNYQKNLLHFIDALKHNNIEFISAGFFLDEPLSFNKKQKVRLCNFNELFVQDNINQHDIALSPADPHLNLQGHRLCAEYLYNMIVNGDGPESKK